VSSLILNPYKKKQPKPNQHLGAIMSILQTLEQLTESIRLLHTELCYWRPCKEQSTKLSINHSDRAVPTILPPILDTLPTLLLFPSDVIHTVYSADFHLAICYDNYISLVSHMLTSRMRFLTWNHFLLQHGLASDNYFISTSNIASIDSFYYSSASMLFRLGIG